LENSGETISRETLDLVKKIEELKAKKYSSVKISEMLGVPRYKVEYLSACFNLSKTLHKKKLSREVCLDIARRYVNGETIENIAREYSLSRDTVVRVIAALGAKRTKKPWKRVDKDTLVKLFYEGLSDEEIAEYFKVSRQYITFLRSRLKLYRKKPGRLSKLQILEALISMLNEKRVVDSVEFYRATGWRITKNLLDTAERLEMPIGYVKIHEASSHSLKIFPVEMCGRYIVYKKGYEEEAVKRLLSIANPRAPMLAVRIRLSGPLLDYIPSTGSVKYYIRRLKHRGEKSEYS
jgi:orotate phosphoribosyltransferase-like protein